MAIERGRVRRIQVNSPPVVLHRTFGIALPPLHTGQLAIQERAVGRQLDGPLVRGARLIEPSRRRG